MSTDAPGDDEMLGRLSEEAERLDERERERLLRSTPELKRAHEAWFRDDWLIRYRQACRAAGVKPIVR